MDLGGLGAKEGPKLSQAWVPPSVVPTIIPWLVLVGLLLLKSNRCFQAWAIWVPVCLLVGLQPLIRALGTNLPADVTEFFCSAAAALAFGLGALWLCMQKLAWRHRFLTFLACALVLAAASGAASLLIDGLNENVPAAAKAVALGMAALVLALALTLTGLLCRRKYGWARILVWMTVCCFAITTISLAPFFIVALLTERGSLKLTEFLAPVGLFGGSCLLAVLPFLILAFVNNLYRERLKGLLHLGDQPTPPLVAPAASENAPEPVPEFHPH